MGRELVRQLSAAGCDVAMRDISDEAMDETIELAQADAPPSIRLTAAVAEWRVVIGDDDAALDTAMRLRPTEVYTDGFMDDLRAAGHFAGGGLIDG